jgi:hypothetical protein
VSVLISTDLVQRWCVASELLGEPLVHCPSCNEAYTHFQGIEYCASGGEPVTVRFRHGEDDPQVFVVVEQGATITGHGPVEQSPRRGSVMLVFMCEQCLTFFGLTFEQHKGNEFVYLASFGSELAS